MANFNNLALTVNGVKALLAAQAGTTLILSKIGMGSGSAVNSTSLTNLVTPELMMPITEKVVNEDSNYITISAKMTNENITEGFYWRETGLFFKDAEGNDVLFAYACVVDDQYDYVPAYSDQRYVKHVRIANVLTDSSNVTIEEAEGLTYVDTLTFEEFKEEVSLKIEEAGNASAIKASTTVYVSPEGSDENEGTAESPLLTIQEAINRCPLITGIPAEDNTEMHYTISVSEGTYNESLRIVGKRLGIETSGTVVVTALSISSSGQATLRGTFHFSNEGANCITLYNSKLYCFGTIKVLAGSIGIILAEGSQVVCRDGVIDINNTTWSAVQLGDAGVGYIEELTGADNTGAGIRCAKAVMWTATNTLTTSGTPIIVTDGGIVNTGTLNTEDKTLFGAINEIYDSVIIGTNRTNINEGDDLNNYTKVGLFKCIISGTAETLSNCPATEAFKLDVLSATGENTEIDTSTFTYIVQRISTLSGKQYIRDINSDGTLGTVNYGNWKMVLDTSDVIDNLESTATNVPLSANQGREVAKRIDDDFVELYNIIGNSGDSFGAQTITVENLSLFKKITIIVKYGNSAVGLHETTNLTFTRNCNTATAFINCYSSGHYFASRQITVNFDNNTITFGEAKLNNTTNNTKCIPVYIYGEHRIYS